MTQDWASVLGKLFQKQAGELCEAEVMAMGVRSTEARLLSWHGTHIPEKILSGATGKGNSYDPELPTLIRLSLPPA